MRCQALFHTVLSKLNGEVKMNFPDNLDRFRENACRNFHFLEDLFTRTTRLAFHVQRSSIQPFNDGIAFNIYFYVAGCIVINFPL